MAKRESKVKSKVEDLVKRLEKEFSFLRSKVLGVLLFGSCVEGVGRDIDICIIAPKQKPEEIIRDVNRKIDVYSKKYHVYVFEELPLYIKAEIINKNKVIIGNAPDIYEYFYFFRKLWTEQKHRQLTRKELISLLRK